MGVEVGKVRPMLWLVGHSTSDSADEDPASPLSSLPASDQWESTSLFPT